MKQKVYKSGSSLVVVVPSDFVDVIGVNNGDTVKVLADYSRGVLHYTFSGTKQLTLVHNIRTQKHR